MWRSWNEALTGVQRRRRRSAEAFQKPAAFFFPFLSSFFSRVETYLRRGETTLVKELQCFVPRDARKAVRQSEPLECCECLRESGTSETPPHNWTLPRPVHQARLQCAHAVYLSVSESEDWRHAEKERYAERLAVLHVTRHTPRASANMQPGSVDT